MDKKNEREQIITTTYDLQNKYKFIFIENPWKLDNFELDGIHYILYDLLPQTPSIYEYIAFRRLFFYRIKYYFERALKQ